MLDQILEVLEYASGLINLFAVLVIIFGLAWALGRYAIQLKSLGREADFAQFKIWLARPLTLGLEILVLADVIETITVKPSLKSLAFLALLVLVRTLLSWTLSMEVEGRWPWQAPSEGRENGC